MAEGFARELGQNKIVVKSSGLEASAVNPTAIEVMLEVGIDITHQTSDALKDFRAEDFDIVISLCGCGVNLPENWLTREVFQDWQLEDPAGQDIAIFREVRDEIKQRVEKLISALN